MRKGMRSLVRLFDRIKQLVGLLPFASRKEPVSHSESPLDRPQVKLRTMGDTLARMPFIDDLDAADRATSDDSMRSALTMSRPENWWGTGASHDLLRAARDEGLPLAWVPRRKTIKLLNAAADADARLAILVAHRDEIVSDCEDLLDYCTEPDLRSQVGLAQRAIAALRHGHHEAAMALAVALGESLAVWASTPRVRGFDSKQDQADWEALRKDRRTGGKYNYARIEIARLPPGNVEFWDFNDHVLMAPVPRFFTSFYPERGDVLPTSLSRHAVVHQPTLAHFSDTNALLSIMLVCSILRSQEEWIEEVRFQDRLDGTDYADD
jgi:hypothetical protein